MVSGTPSRNEWPIKDKIFYVCVEEKNLIVTAII